VSRPGADGQAGSADPIRCHCGEVLADRIYEKTVVIDGVEFQFQRESDLLTCPRCAHGHPMRSLRPVRVPPARDTGLRRRRDDRSD
jgi:hypothetical protein